MTLLRRLARYLATPARAERYRLALMTRHARLAEFYEREAREMRALAWDVYRRHGARPLGRVLSAVSVAEARRDRHRAALRAMHAEATAAPPAGPYVAPLIP